jgi:UDP-3-O-[3-hydroxymyristoyl] glucosamine N-acyltransferase
MQFTAAQIAIIINGKIEGDAMVTVGGFGKIEEAKAGQIAFLANPKYEDFLYQTSASIIIINESQELKKAINATLIRVPDAYTAFATLLATYQEAMVQQLSGIQQPSYVAASATLGENIFIGAFAYIGEGVKLGNNVKIFPGVVLGNDVVIGDGTVLNAGVKVYFNCAIGKNVIIHAGAVIGSDGFGYAPQADGTLQKVPQIGNVVIEDNVEIGSNTAIDRATIGSTIIHAGVKLDNLVQIAHNVEVGYNTGIASQTGVSGSTKIGDNVMIGGQTGIAGHISIADGTRISGQSGITKTIKTPYKTFTGTPAAEVAGALRLQALTRNLPALEKRLKELEKMVDQLISDRVNAE